MVRDSFVLVFVEIILCGDIEVSFEDEVFYNRYKCFRRNLFLDFFFIFSFYESVKK